MNTKTTPAKISLTRVTNDYYCFNFDNYRFSFNIPRQDNGSWGVRNRDEDEIIVPTLAAAREFITKRIATAYADDADDAERFIRS